jgi:P-type Cu+ transporter
VSGATGETRIDAVCGMTVDVDQARAEGRILQHEGSSYVFCSAGCLSEFVASPETYEEQAVAPDGTS